MPFKCKLLAKDKASTKALVAKYDLPATVLAMVTELIDALEDTSHLAEGVSRVIDVSVEGNISGGFGGSYVKLNVCYRLVY